MSTDTSNKTKYSDDHLNYCGAHFCNDLDLTNLTGNGNSSSAGSGSIIEPPAVELVRLLCGILLGFALLATVLIALFVDPLTEYCNTNSSFIQLRKFKFFIFQRFGEAAKTESNGTGGKTGWRLLAATFQHMRNPDQILIIPLTLW